MADYVDKVSFEIEQNSDDDDFLPNNEIQEQLIDILASYEDFVIMMMNYNVTKVLNVNDVKRVILYLFDKADGTVDIRQCAYLVCICIDNIEPYWVDIQRMLSKLFEKYDNV